jgi:hypothetical protein
VSIISHFRFDCRTLCNEFPEVAIGPEPENEWCELEAKEFESRRRSGNICRTDDAYRFHTLRMPERKFLRDIATERMTDQHRGLVAELIDESQEILGHG